MSLDALAPEQRAVIQLVAQQGRSYEELAELLRIPPTAVRERARAGLAALTPPEGLDEDEQADVTDFLLGQGPETERATTGALLATEPEFHSWASGVAAQLHELRGATVPGVPDLAVPTALDVAPPEDLGTAGSGVTTTDGRTGEEAEPAAPAAETTAPAEAPAAAASGEDEPAVRARPRPARAVRPVATDGPADAAPGAPRSNKAGGLVLLALVALVVIALIVFVATRGGDDAAGTASGASTPAASTATPSATATATGTASAQDSRFAQVGSVPLKGPAGSKASGQAAIFLDAKTGTVTWTLQSQGLQANTGNDGYAVWLTGGSGAPLRLGFNSQAPVGADGALVLRGPIGKSKAKPFTERFPKAANFVVSLETTPDPSSPSRIVLSGQIPSGTPDSSSDSG